MTHRPEPPQLMPTTVSDGRGPGVYYRIDGELVPVLHIWLDGSVPVFFEHHIVLWKDPALNIGVRGKGALKRMVAGMQLLLTEARGPGQIAFSRDGAGHGRLDPIGGGRRQVGRSGDGAGLGPQQLPGAEARRHEGAQPRSCNGLRHAPIFAAWTNIVGNPFSPCGGKWREAPDEGLLDLEGRDFAAKRKTARLPDPSFALWASSPARGGGFGTSGQKCKSAKL